MLFNCSKDIDEIHVAILRTVGEAWLHTARYNWICLKHRPEPCTPVSIRIRRLVVFSTTVGRSSRDRHGQATCWSCLSVIAEVRALGTDQAIVGKARCWEHGLAVSLDRGCQARMNTAQLGNVNGDVSF